MNNEELDRLEQDLNAVAGQLGTHRTWEEFEPRVRKAMRLPKWRLAYTIALIIVCVAAGTWIPNAWMVAAGLLFAVLPDRLRDVRDRRRATASAEEGDLFELYRRELEHTGASHFTGALFNVGLALLFGLVAIFATDSRPGLIAAAILVVAAAVRMIWFFPRPYRELRELDRNEVAS